MLIQLIYGAQSLYVEKKIYRNKTVCHGRIKNNKSEKKKIEFAI